MYVRHLILGTADAVLLVIHLQGRIWGLSSSLDLSHPPWFQHWIWQDHGHPQLLLDFQSSSLLQVLI